MYRSKAYDDEILIRGIADKQLRLELLQIPTDFCENSANHH